MVSVTGTPCPGVAETLVGDADRDTDCTEGTVKGRFALALVPAVFAVTPMVTLVPGGGNWEVGTRQTSMRPVWPAGMTSDGRLGSAVNPVALSVKTKLSVWPSVFVMLVPNVSGSRAPFARTTWLAPGAMVRAVCTVGGAPIF